MIYAVSGKPYLPARATGAAGSRGGEQTRQAEVTKIMQLDLSPFRNALARLAEALEFCNSDLTKGNPRLARFFQGGAIQAFAYTYELSIKMLKRYLQEHELSAGAADALSFEGLMRRGYETGLVHSELAVWKQFRHCRNLSSHAYDANKAEEVYRGIPAFAREAQLLLAELEKRQND